MLNYQCERCGHTTTSKQAFKRHLNRITTCDPLCQDIDVIALYQKYFPNTPEKHRNCSYCNKSFVNKQNLNRHVSSIHQIYYNNAQKLKFSGGSTQPLPPVVVENTPPICYTGYVYLIHPIEFINSNQTVYKIGHSKSNTVTRVSNGYKKGSCVILILESSTPDEHESIIKSTLNNTKGIKLFSGSEYFEGDKNIIKTIILNIVAKANIKYKPLNTI